MIAVVILYVLNSTASLTFLGKVGSLISNVKIPGGLEIAFAGAAVKQTQEEVLKGYRQQVIAQYDAAATQFQISETVNRIIKDKINPFFGDNVPDFRCTIHVRDTLFQNSLYQLIDYLPRSSSGQGGRGRAWSTRYGMMGRFWRLEETGYQGSVPTNERQLINDWGMTKAEAEGASGRQTLFCQIVRAKNQSPTAIFYLDAQSLDAFGNQDRMKQLSSVVESAIAQYGLDSALESVWRQVQSSAPLIEIYAERK